MVWYVPEGEIPAAIKCSLSLPMVPILLLSDSGKKIGLGNVELLYNLRKLHINFCVFKYNIFTY